MSEGWKDSAAAWLIEMGQGGDYARKFVLDSPMLDRIKNRGFKTALDVGCGEGRFCRLMQREGISTVGIDPEKTFIDRAKTLDPPGDYRIGHAETLNVVEGSFDLVVSYLSLIDIPGLAGATLKMVGALRPGGTLLIANLTSFNTVGMPDGWTRDNRGERRFCIDHYLDERVIWVSWRDVRVQNWHRPLSTYIGLFLQQGLELRHFSEPVPTGGDRATADHYRRVPWFHIMEWQKRIP